jgi:fluoroacetyl-CoA thioesterase
MKATLTPGLTARMDYRVGSDRTVPRLLPEAQLFTAMPAVLATGYLVGLVEWTCMEALEGHLGTGERTVGTHIDLSHDAPTPPGSTVTIEAELVDVQGRRLSFEVTARDEAAVVCRGRHRRAVIDLDRFEAAVARRVNDHGGAEASAART